MMLQAPEASTGAWGPGSSATALSFQRAEPGRKTWPWLDRRPLGRLETHSVSPKLNTACHLWKYSWMIIGTVCKHFCIYTSLELIGMKVTWSNLCFKIQLSQWQNRGAGLQDFKSFYQLEKILECSTSNEEHWSIILIHSKSMHDSSIVCLPIILCWFKFCYSRDMFPSWHL